MSSPSDLYRDMTWIMLLVAVISAVLLGFIILKLIGLVRKAQIISVPLLEQQDIEFATSGRVVLCIEGPRGTSRFAHLNYVLIARDGTRVKGRTIWFRPRTSGVSKVRLGIESYEIPRPGRYILRIQGQRTGWTADTEHRIVFVRPHLARSIVYVVGITLSGVLLIGSTVLFLIRLTER